MAPRRACCHPVAHTSILVVLSMASDVPQGWGGPSPNQEWCYGDYSDRNHFTGQVQCIHCKGEAKNTFGHSCAELLHDEANQVLCLKFQGWTKKKRNWRCPQCSVRYCMGPEQVFRSQLRCRHGLDASSSSCGGCGDVPPPPPPLRRGEVPQPPPPPPPFRGSACNLRFPPQCASLACLGCLRACESCFPFRIAIASSFVDRLSNLTILLNSLPTSLTPDFLLNPMNEEDVRVWARQNVQGMDHGNLSGSILLLALLRPHLYKDNPVPLRLFGYPPPVQLLAEDRNPHSGGGPDNKRTNLVEALCAFWHNSLQASMTGDLSAEYALTALQDAWHMTRLRVDFVIQRQHPDLVHCSVNAHQIIYLVLQVEDNALMQEL